MESIPELVYYPDTRPGITRKRAGTGWSYTAPDGTRIDNTAERKRLNALAVPPAYHDVWMCPCADGHLQATGRDDRDRKQYRYHDFWTEYRAFQKFDHLAAFGEQLPKIRRRINADLRGTAGDRGLAIAAVLAMIDRLSLRVGNRDYAEENGTFGATTLRPQHVKLTENALALNYPGKGGKKITRKLRDKKLAQVLHQLDDLPGATLVSWADDHGRMHEVTSSQVNDLLTDITGEDFTAKTFRTWNGTVAALDTAMKTEDLTIKAMAEAAASCLGNTPTIARNSYIHPDVIDLADAPFAQRQALAEVPEMRGLRISERAALSFLSR